MEEQPTSKQLIERSLAAYDAFYAEVQILLEYVEKHFGHFILLGIHSSNHRRNGPDEAIITAIQQALQSTLPGVLSELGRTTHSSLSVGL